MRRPSRSHATTENARDLRGRQTMAEALFWDIVRDRRLDGMKFRRQHRIGTFIADFYCAEHRLVVEIDGDIHQHQAEYDAIRDLLMRDLGLKILRITNDELRLTRAQTIAKVREALSS
ncbi:MAG: endonuclease domain-containing protein [Dehalococcoidia bacterium]